MLGENLCPDDHIFPSATKACAILGRCDVGKSVHCLVIKTGYDVDVFVGSSLVDMYAKCGDINESRKVFDEMPQRNVVSWSGMIYGYTQLGEHEEAMRLFKEALLEGLDVNDFTLSSVIRVCGSATLLELGKQCGLIEEAYRIFDEVPIRNLGMWNAMLIACLHVMLSNAYAAAGRYEDAAKARKMLRDRGVKKETGLSWIEEGNRVHKFAAGLESRSRNSIKRLKRGVTFLIHHPTRVIHWYVMVQAEAMWHYFIVHLVTEMIGTEKIGLLSVLF
ncbi:hypothetical protein OIU77_017884 [Salix suchowensis]|uniref:Pentatricopeptide repeat-containing protein n=1 Tax=Salix suchowensis TaxID=1278906 RepID=A0ABQ8ZQA8_9ROSI|nr:hypothetical protein OIU77_017884 [Salix suchowensis]